MAVNSAGDLIATNTSGNDVSLFTPQGGTPTLLGSFTNFNPNGVAVDSANNLYIGVSNNSMVLKIPYVNGTYAALAATTSSTPNCTGATDTVECIMNNVTISGGSGVVSMVFDSQGDMFFGTTNNNQGGSNPNSIYECTAACLYSGSPAATLLFKEPTSATPNTTGQLSIGGMAVDASGNLFFTDSAIGKTNTQESFSSNVNELPYTPGTTSGTYATAPTVIYTYTPATPANNDAEIDGVATSPNGTVYALLQSTGGILAFPKGSSGAAYSSNTIYLVSTQSGKLMTSDSLGNLYIADNNNSANMYQIVLNSLVATTSAVGTPSIATNITTILNDGACASGPLVTFAASGTAAAQFSAATTGTCTATYTSGGAFATTVTFSPTTTGINTATLTATDSNGSKGTATVIGTATGTVATPTFSVAAGTYTTIQSVTISDTTVGASIYYTTNGSTPTASSTLYSGPITVGYTETINAIGIDSGDTSSAVATAAYTMNVPIAATPTFSVTAGTYVTVQTVSLTDATTGVKIYYTTNGSTPTTSSTVYTGSITVGVSETITAIAVDTPNYNNSVVASAAYVINLPPPAFAFTSPGPTITVPVGGGGPIILTITANAAFNGSIAFNCSGFLPVGATCAFSPATVTTLALATTTTTLTVTVPSTTAELHRGPGPLFAGTILAGVLWLGGLRKRRRLQLLLLLVLSAIGMSMSTGCATTTSSSTTSSQIVVGATGSSCPVSYLTCATNPQKGEPAPVGVSESIPLVLTIQ